MAKVSRNGSKDIEEGQVGVVRGVLGRSHRAKPGKARLKLAIDLTREVLQVPGDYRIAIVPASDTGAVEMAMWSLLGARGVDLLAWESFGEGWVTDAVKQLKLKDAREKDAEVSRLELVSKWSIKARVEEEASRADLS